MIKLNGTLMYGHQYIDDADIDAVVQTLKSDFLTCGPRIDELEEKLCHITGAKYAVALSNGTAALHAACYAAGIGPDDEVITTPLTFAASANCVLYCGGKPVFADIDADTWNISPKEIERNITQRTKAVIAVDFTGQAVQLDEIRSICKKHRLRLIEDAAHAIGTRYNGKPVGSVSDMTAFSFHPVKTVTGGEGGAVTTNDPELYQALRLFRTHGITRDCAFMENPSDDPWYYEQIDLGYNYRITDFQAALIISQLDKLSMFAKRRKEIVRRYNDAFARIPALIVQKEIPQSDTVRHLYILRFNRTRLNASRRQIYDFLKDRGIVCNVHYIPIYYFPYYQKLGYQKGACPNAEAVYEDILTLPLYYGLSDGEVDTVIQKVCEAAKCFRK